MTHPHLSRPQRARPPDEAVRRGPDGPAECASRTRPRRRAASTDAGGMLEFAVRYAREIKRLRTVNPVSYAERGHLGEARSLADLHFPQMRTVWYLLLAWERYLARADQSCLALLDEVTRTGHRCAAARRDTAGRWCRCSCSRRSTPPHRRGACSPPTTCRRWSAGCSAWDAAQRRCTSIEQIDDSTLRTPCLNLATTLQVQEALEGHEERDRPDLPDNARRDHDLAAATLP